MDVNRSDLWPDIHHEERCVRLLICWLITEKSAFSTHAKFIWIVDFNHYSFKISRCFWLDPVPRKFFITNWRLPYLEDATNIPSILWYISLETRLVDGIFAWKQGCLGNSDGYSKTKYMYLNLQLKTERKKCENISWNHVFLKKSTGRSTYLELKSILNE